MSPVTSIVNGAPVPGVRTVASTNPARLDEVVGEVAFAGWTADGRMRHPSWRGLRDDLVPEDVVEEW